MWKAFDIKFPSVLHHSPSSVFHPWWVHDGVFLENFKCLSVGSFLFWVFLPPFYLIHEWRLLSTYIIKAERESNSATIVMLTWSDFSQPSNASTRDSLKYCYECSNNSKARQPCNIARDEIHLKEQEIKYKLLKFLLHKRERERVEAFRLAGLVHKLTQSYESQDSAITRHRRLVSVIEAAGWEEREWHFLWWGMDCSSSEMSTSLDWRLNVI